MMDTRVYGRGTVLFRQGDPGDCMYCVENGKVGVFDDYGGPNEKKIADLMTNDLFGEMGLLDHAPRSATVVVLDDAAMITTISEDDFNAFFKENPAMILMLAQQMSHRLRRTTEDYVNACRTVYETVESEKNGAARSEGLLARIAKLCQDYLGFAKEGKA